ncbi:hypothetical protein [Kitasatospora azatica]|uniref:hypothetical protein n=1 Tax=Kitasatospora azatica TaxID=58347 RepID=UPI0005699E6C|nr:hypothetical protein [Kitasatospora azatica]
MHIHRSAHVRSFTVLPNGLLQDRRLSYTARGLLVDLLSRPDGWREDGRQMADSSPQGRGAIRKALKELMAAGYYRVDTVRMPNGTVRSEAHVFDTPQLGAPGVMRPGAGEARLGSADIPPVKKLVEVPTLPGSSGESTAMPDEQVRVAVQRLFRVIKPEPRLWVGEAEARKLAPLVAEWLERGSTPAELARALLPGLPATVHSPVGVLRSRLERKMPPVRSPEPSPTARRQTECAKCHDPVARPGICRVCAGLGGRVIAVGGGAAVSARGAGRARDALRAARAGLAIGRLAAG